jgi:DNA-binding protein H-NS
MASDLKKLTVAELDALIEKAQTVREETRERRRIELKSELELRLKEEGFSAIEVLGAKVKPKPQQLPAKYADPTDASQTWSGKGRMPGWLQAKIDGGMPLDSFIITSITRTSKNDPSG